MPLLHLDSGAHHSGESVSRRLTALFADTWKAAHPAGEYRYRDLAADPVPPLDSAYCALGRRLERHGARPPADVGALVEGPAEARTWALTRPLITELLAAGTLLIGAPMYNFGVPAALKVWIDRVNFPGALTDPETGEGLLRGTRVVVVSARGGAYGPGTPHEACDFQVPYLRAFFGRLGVAGEDLHIVSTELTMAGVAPRLASLRPVAEGSLAAARAEVTALAGGAARPEVRAGSAGR